MHSARSVSLLIIYHRERVLLEAFSGMMKKPPELLGLRLNDFISSSQNPDSWELCPFHVKTHKKAFNRLVVTMHLCVCACVCLCVCVFVYVVGLLFAKQMFKRKWDGQNEIILLFHNPPPPIEATGCTPTHTTKRPQTNQNTGGVCGVCLCVCVCVFACVSVGICF